MSAFTGALQQKNSYNGQDHQRSGGKVWALVNDGHGVEKGKLAADFCAFAMEADIKNDGLMQVGLYVWNLNTLAIIIRYTQAGNKLHIGG